MTAHPLNLAIFACDVVTALLLLMAALSSARIVSGWQPGRATRTQLQLERRSEAASLQGRFAALVFLLGSAAYIIDVSAVLPNIVPGAMCGTGVVQATGGLAVRALVLRFIALLLLAAWQLYDNLDRSAPTAPLGTMPARLLLLTTPITILASFDTTSALRSLDFHTPVDCCAIVYDRISPNSGHAGGLCVPDPILIWSTLGLGVLLLAATAWTWRGTKGPGKTEVAGGTRRAGGPKPPNRTLPSMFLAGLTFVWVPVAAIGLVRVFSAYHYGVLNHHCPWCLFLGRHHWVGFPLFGALAVVLFNGGGALLMARIGVAHPELGIQTALRTRRSVLRIVIAMLLFGLLAGLPALLWRLKQGVWITG